MGNGKREMEMNRFPFPHFPIPVVTAVQHPTLDVLTTKLSIQRTCAAGEPAFQ